ncbi:RHS repeat-associated core domain-containing protein [Candidatus Amarolinea aalborgensis]|uniref:RHS repeat-associated core domain-containing protein n=1 Tax=Candidatus Amarolinea aalborgensis TaxID=2249329 RepID=UPI003BF9C51E
MVSTSTYDAENRLTAMTGGITASYVYDGDGNRVKETIAGVTRVFVGNTYAIDNGAVKKYYYAGSVRVAENSGGALYYLLGDHLGSTAVTLDSAGNRLNTNTEIRYYPYGAPRYTAGATPTTFNFTGQRRDSGSRLLYYGARWYDPVIGRFISADTIVPQPGNPQSLNRYSYAANNPLRFVDPSGHRECEGASHCNGPDPALPAAPPAYRGPCISVVCLPTSTHAPAMMMPGTPDPQWVAPTATPYAGAWVGPGGPWTPTSTPHPYVPPSQRINRPSVYWAIVAAYNELPQVVSKFTPVTARAAGRTAVFVPFPEPVIKTADYL